MFLQPLSATGETQMSSAAAPELGQREWQVVRLAIREADRLGISAVESGSAAMRGLRRAWSMLTGSRPVAGFADARLEALRRFVALARRGDARMRAAAEALTGYGFQPATVSLIGLVAKAR